MKHLFLILILFVGTIFSCTHESVPVSSNVKTETVKIYGNCDMCKKTIEKAGNKNKIAGVDWNKDTKMAVITYDSMKTNQDEILKRIALSGYDSEKFLAPNDVYAKLPQCCQYERMAQTVANAEIPNAEIPNTETQKPEVSKVETPKAEVLKPEMSKVETPKAEVPKTEVSKVETPKVETPKVETPKVEMPKTGVPKAETPKKEMKEDHSTHKPPATTETKQESAQLKAVFDNYFAMKDALVETDGNTASTKAKELLKAINAVKMDKLSTEEHTVWMKVMKDLAFDAEHIADTKDASHQRDHFITLSENMYALIKVSKTETPTYYQFCPMANDGKGANWLSKENAVKNPYYGSQMLNCGKVVETIK